jgi:hypothetical protein
MKKTIYTLALATSLLFTFSCKKDTETTSVTPGTVSSTPNATDSETSKISLESTFSSLRTQISDLSSNQGYKAGTNLISIIDNSSNNERKKKASSTFQDIKTFELEYNSATGDLDTINTNATHLIIHFPSEENGTVNNTTLNLYNIEFNEEAEENITVLKLDFVVDGETIAAIDASATYDLNSEIDIKTLNGIASLGDLSITGDFKAFSTIISASASFKENQTSIIDFAAELAFKDNIYDELKSVEGHVALFNLNIKGIADIEGAEKIRNEIEADMNKANDYMTMGFYNFETDSKYGDLTISAKADEIEDFLIVYEDGTEESLKTLTADLVEDIEQEMN